MTATERADTGTAAALFARCANCEERTDELVPWAGARMCRVCACTA